MRKPCSFAAAFLLCSAFIGSLVSAQKLPYSSKVIVLDHPSGFTALPDGIAVQDGSGRWKNIRIEVYGWKPWAKSATLNGKAMTSAPTAIGHGFAVTIPASSQGFILQLH